MNYNNTIANNEEEFQEGILRENEEENQRENDSRAIR